MIDEAIAELEPLVGVRQACRATGRPQATHYRRHRRSPKPPRPVRQRRAQPRALSQVERDTVRAVLNSEDFVDKAPATVYHELLDEGTYVASVSTMYRILRAHGEVKERRRQAVHSPGSSRNSLPRNRTSAGAGTSPSCTAQRSGPTSTCT